MIGEETALSVALTHCGASTGKVKQSAALSREGRKMVYGR
ncbi:hypothetical protein AtDm6_2892 [Acetobacter tropicalis]|uniref:Uncharacterized protein n=1 Tax=Acetobacter tropicalis TaxID=104102 RepID=A0A094ZFC2_9PROT|nr:hypothetical protein AtDm6_2892 [Acetobacter tropicalis]